MTLPMKQAPPLHMKIQRRIREFDFYNQSAWDNLMPHMMAEVYLGPHQRPFVASMYHSIHCLDLIHETLLDPAERGSFLDEHTTHCINYIRQMALCQGDTTMEPLEERGVGVSHVCGDWRATDSWVEENYQSWMSTNASRQI